MNFTILPSTHLSNNIVQSGAKSPTRYNGRIDSLGVKMQIFPRPSTDIRTHGLWLISRLDSDIGKNAFMNTNEFIVLCSIGKLPVRFFVAASTSGAAVIEGGHDVFDAVAFGWEIFAEVFEVPEVDVIDLYISGFECKKYKKRCMRLVYIHNNE